MKITISKSQWEQIGKTAGWMKKTVFAGIKMVCTRKCELSESDLNDISSQLNQGYAWEDLVCPKCNHNSISKLQLPDK